MRLTFTEIKNKISKLVPEGLEYDVDLEAGSISIITKEPASFGGAGGNSLTVKIAKAIRRRAQPLMDKYWLNTGQSVTLLHRIYRIAEYLLKRSKR